MREIAELGHPPEPVLVRATTKPIGFLADLILALGWSLWTGVVVAVFVQVIPKVERRQFKLALDAYEATRREKSGSASDEAAGEVKARPAQRST